MRRARRIRLLALTLLLLPLRLDAGQDVWTPIGPEQGTITALAFSINGDTAYAATLDGGVFKSVNSGRSWARSGDGLRGTVAELEADPIAPATVYAATFQGVFKTDDAGATWTDLTSRLPGLSGVKSAWSVTTTPAEPGTVYASLYDYFVYEGSQARVYRSTDRGASWQLAVAGLPRTLRVQALAAHPRQRASSSRAPPTACSAATTPAAPGPAPVCARATWCRWRSIPSGPSASMPCAWSSSTVFRTTRRSLSAPREARGGARWATATPMLSRRLVLALPALAEIQRRAHEQLAGFHGGVKRFVNPHRYPVGLEQELFDLKTRLVLEARGLATA